MSEISDIFIDLIFLVPHESSLFSFKNKSYIIREHIIKNQSIIWT
jgi:hypothetical protein